MNAFKLAYQLLILWLILQLVNSYKGFIVDIFTTYRKVSSVVGIGICWNKTDQIELIKSLSAVKIRTSFPPANVDLFKTMKVPHSGGIGIITQSDCRDSKTFLEKASELMLFNRTYKWLILAENETDPDVIFKDVRIRIDADVTLSAKRGNGINIYDIYGFLARQGQPLVVNQTGNYTSRGLHILPQGIKYRVRSNFRQYPVIVGTVISQNFSDIQGNVSELLRSRSHSQGIVALTKYHNDLIIITRDMFNYTILYDVDQGWAGKAPNGTPVGALGFILRREVDVLGTGIYITGNRPEKMDYIPSYWLFETALLYRVSGLEGAHDGSITEPFRDEVWVATLVIAIAVFLFLRISANPSNEFSSCGLSSLSTVAAFCQQGMEPWPSQPSQRLISLILYLTTMVLYTYYTSSIVGWLLSVDPVGLHTLEQVADSPLIVVFEKVGYGEVLVKQRHIRGMNTLYEKKLKQPRGEDEPPLFVTNEVGVSLLQKQLVAYHTEPKGTYQLIAETFDQQQICELRQVNVYEKATLYTVFPKRSPLTKMFSIGFLKAKETGLISRFLKLRSAERPACTSNFVAPVGWHGVAVAFKLLACGAGLSIFILILEKILKQPQSKRK